MDIKFVALDADDKKSELKGESLRFEMKKAVAV